jgi:hypothetical protein
MTSPIWFRAPIEGGADDRYGFVKDSNATFLLPNARCKTIAGVGEEFEFNLPVKKIKTFCWTE